MQSRDYLKIRISNADRKITVTIGATRAIPRCWRGSPRSYVKIDHGIRRVKDRLSGAIVTIERDDLRCRTKAAGKVEDVANGCRTKRIDRLCIVADNREPVPGWFESQQDR